MSKILQSTSTLHARASRINYAGNIIFSSKGHRNVQEMMQGLRGLHQFMNYENACGRISITNLKDCIGIIV